MKLFEPGLDLFIGGLSDVSVSHSVSQRAVAVATAVGHSHMQPAYTRCSTHSPFRTHTLHQTDGNWNCHNVSADTFGAGSTSFGYQDLGPPFTPTRCPPIYSPRRHGC